VTGVGRWFVKQSVVIATLGLLACGQTKSTGAVAEPPAASGDSGGDGAGGSPPVPDGCEEAGGFVGEPSWSGTLTVDSGAVYCSQFPSAKSLREEFDTKARVTILPGRYQLPSGGGEVAFKLPLCVAEAGRVFVSDVGSMVHTATESAGSVVHRYRWEQSLIGAEASIVSDLTMRSNSAALVAVTLSGVAFLPGDAVSFLQQRCDAIAVCDENSLNFQPCSSPNYSEYAYRAEFADGWVEFYVQRGPGLGATARSVLVRAIGSLSETRFEQADFFKLILRNLPAPQFAVLFDRPVSGIAGIEVQDFSVAPPETGTAPPRAYLIDANLERIAELSDSTFDFRVVRSGD
jgi:hypothetical protein